MEHVTVYRQPGRFAGWPANYGIWHWGGEIVVGFTVGWHKTVARGHAIDKSRPVVNRQARSLDGGRSWRIEAFNGERPGQRGLSADEHMDAGLRLGEVMDATTAALPSQPLDFEQPDFAMMLARTGLARGVFSFLYASSDRCRSWQGPFRLPMFGMPGIAARTDYLILDERSALFFLTANKGDGEEGKVICARTDDGGRSYTHVSDVGADFLGKGDFATMPASLRLPGGRILCARRRRSQAAARKTWIDLYASDDDARTWRCLNQPVSFHDPIHVGNPPCLLQLPDGRVLLMYGNRDAPGRICAKLSGDGGQTWSDEIVLRGGDGSWDLGYVRAIALDDGSVVAVYYFNDRADGDGERFIEALIWQP